MEILPIGLLDSDKVTPVYLRSELMEYLTKLKGGAQQAEQFYIENWLPNKSVLIVNDDTYAAQRADRSLTELPVQNVNKAVDVHATLNDLKELLKQSEILQKNAENQLFERLNKTVD